MEPLDDRELSALLREWKAPEAPAHLVAPKRVSRQPWWRWLATGTIRVPVPVGLAAAVLAAVWLYSGVTRRQPVVDAPSAVHQPVVSLADFQPVEEIRLRVVGEIK